MYKYRRYFTLGWICLAFLLLVLSISCGGAAPTQAPFGVEQPVTQPPVVDSPAIEQPVGVLPEMIDISQLEFAETVTQEQSRALMQNFRQMEPGALQSLDNRLMSRHPDRKSPVGELMLDWDLSDAAFVKDSADQYQVDVLAVPVMPSDPKAFSPETLDPMIAAGALNELVVGAMLVRSDLEGGLAAGDYLAVWHPLEDQVWLVNAATGENAQTAYCVVDQSDVYGFDLFEGSLGWCIKFDSRRCCI